ncbi:inositol-pentakisphosphate 2-kinase, partial [Haematococcus lacustris]
MHALHKHLEGAGPMSRYDPRDLFSQQRGRVAQALRQLRAVPNNNLRVFLDGKLVVGKLPQAHTMMHGADGDQVGLGPG